MTTINVDTARAHLRRAALRHCARCNPSGGDGEPINTGIATGLDLDQAALTFAAAKSRDRRWRKLAQVGLGVLIGDILMLIVLSRLL